MEGTAGTFKGSRRAPSPAPSIEYIHKRPLPTPKGYIRPHPPIPSSVRAAAASTPTINTTTLSRPSTGTGSSTSLPIASSVSSRPSPHPTPPPYTSRIYGFDDSSSRCPTSWQPRPTVKAPAKPHSSPPSPPSLANLPAEVLGALFRTISILLPVPIPEKYAYVRSLSVVCRSWRTVILSMPWLWSILSIRVSDTTSRPTPPDVGTFLARSKIHPLSISLAYNKALTPSSKQDKFPNAMNDVLRVLLAHIHHWRSISFHFAGLPPKLEFPDLGVLTPAEEVGFKRGHGVGTGSFDSSTGLLKANGGRRRPLRAALLRRFDLTGSSWFYFPSPQTQWINSILSSSPFLTTFRGNGEFPLTHLALPWSQLTHLHLVNDISLLKALDILEEAYALVECYLLRIKSLDSEVTQRPNTDPQALLNSRLNSPRRILAPRLRTLAIVAKVPIDKIFQSATFPSLTSLAINCAPNITLDYSTFMGFLIRSACNIQTFCLQPSCVDSDELALYLAHIGPTLRELYIRTTDTMFRPFGVISRDVIRRLTKRKGYLDLPWVEDEEILCPGLEVLVLERCLEAELIDGELSEMVESRWRIYHPLPRPTLLPPSPIKLQRLQKLQKASSTTTKIIKSDIAKLRLVEVVLTDDTRYHRYDEEKLRMIFNEGLEGCVGRVPDDRWLKGTGSMLYEGLLFSTYPLYQHYMYPRSV
ncbi:hypothetical protein BDN72DRAFT_848788 [Pluteus cervinus]|uniref:Uncharacterized protein n=1 Tax=Pluteus cervinus TaxID=181527 RepID=A0ACD3A9S3_9AGAR|nr:hypothetical protein BDN72DRAFT_848788 [Pluteus cervinus]